VPEPGFGTLRAHRTPITGTGWKLGVLAWDHRHGLAVGTGDGAVLEVQREVRRIFPPFFGQTTTYNPLKSFML
jgi:hypothetical protein